MPFLIWAATRAGPIGISTGNSVLALVSIVAAVGGNGPSSANYSQHSVLSMQLFLVVIAVPLLFVAILIQQQRRVENSLRESQQSLEQQYERGRLLAHKLINSQEDERRRIARDLHDNIAQRLALLCVSLNEASQLLPVQQGSAQSLFSEFCTSTEDICREVHELSHQLHSSSLQYLGLEVALKKLCDETARQHHIVIDFQSNDTGGIPQEVSLCAFRVAQEALNNAIRHGQADQIGITLLKQADLLRIRISDTGIGFDEGSLSEGLGLIRMRERLRMLGGQLVVNSQPGKGTDIRAEVPLKEAA